MSLLIRVPNEKNYKVSIFGNQANIHSFGLAIKTQVLTFYTTSKEYVTKDMSTPYVH